MRSGPELVRASNAFASEDRATTWRLLVVTAVVYFGTMALAMSSAPLPLRIAASILHGLVFVRVFIFYHDYLHGAVLRGSLVGGALMRLFGWWCLAGASVWRQTHDYHHRNTAKIVGATIGSYPVVTLGMWRRLSAKQRRQYAAARHPLTIAFGYVTVFLLGMCLSAFRRNPRQHIDAVIAVLFHFGTVVAVGLTLGWTAAFLGIVFPQFVACGGGSYLFYAQHNFPGMQLKGREEWEYTFAALRSSSMFDMSRPMHWLTGNIGYHHVHHLNHRIPFYRLPEAMEAMPELQNPARTSWKLGDMIACLRGKVWDPAQERMLTFAEADATRGLGPGTALAGA